MEVMNFNDDSETDDNNNSNEGGSMDWTEFKEQYPELAKQIESQFSDKDQQIQEKDKKIQELSENNTELSDRVNKLEKVEAIRHEKELQNQAKEIVDSFLKESSISEYLHDKVHAQLNHKNFVDQEGNLDQEKFKEAVQAEVKDWDDKFSQLDMSTVQGVGGSVDYGSGDRTEEYEEIANRMVGYVVKDAK